MIKQFLKKVEREQKHIFNPYKNPFVNVLTFNQNKMKLFINNEE